jgi:hypothetical protein
MTLHQRREQLRPDVGIRRPHRRSEPLAIPAVADIAPARVGTAALVHRREERVVAERGPDPLRVVEQSLVGEQPGQRNIRVMRPDMLEVTREDRPLDRRLADHVELQLEQLLHPDERVLAAQPVQLRDPPRRLVAGQQQRQQCHEVRLA